MEQARNMGYAVICYANAPLQASIRAMYDVMKHLKDRGTLEGAEGAVMNFHDRQKFVDYPRYVELEKQYKGA